MDKKLIKNAAEKLELINILVSKLKFNKDENIELFEYPQHIQQQSILSTNCEKIDYKNKDGDFSKLRVYVTTGIRAVDDVKKSVDEIKIFFTIEATHSVDYLLKGELTKDEIYEFSNFNTVHNVWPFWRQYVFQVVNSAGLPKVNIPLMRGFDVKQGKH